MCSRLCFLWNIAVSQYDYQDQFNNITSEMWIIFRVQKTKKGLPVVPESVLKHRRRRDLARAKQVQTSIKRKAAQVKKRKEIFKRAEQYVKEYRLKERDEVRLIRQAKNRGNYYVPGEAKLAFVIRIRG